MEVKGNTEATQRVVIFTVICAFACYSRIGKSFGGERERIIDCVLGEEQGEDNVVDWIEEQSSSLSSPFPRYFFQLPCSPELSDL